MLFRDFQFCEHTFRILRDEALICSINFYKYEESHRTIALQQHVQYMLALALHKNVVDCCYSVAHAEVSAKDQ